MLLGLAISQNKWKSEGYMKDIVHVKREFKKVRGLARLNQNNLVWQGWYQALEWVLKDEIARGEV
jgi:hypothetical protein